MRLTLALVAAVAMSSAATAQLSRVTPHAAARGAIPADKLPTHALTVRSAVYDIPWSAVTFALPFGWTPAARPTVPVPRSALAVARSRAASGLPCGTFQDSVSLAMPIARGFRLAAFELVSLGPTGGGTIGTTVALDESGADVGQDLARATAVRITPPVVAITGGVQRLCGSSYRLSLTLIGPPKVEPFGFGRPPGPRR